MPEILAKTFLTYAVPVGVFLGAVTAFMTFIYVTLRNARSAASAELMSIYTEFWSDEYGDARRWIATDEAYEELADVLNKRNTGTSMAHLSIAEHAVLEKLDRFLVMFVRIEHAKGTFGFWNKRSKHIKDFGAYWQSTILKRPELAQYIRSNWPILTSHASWRRMSDDLTT